MNYVEELPANARFGRRIYGWAVSHRSGDAMVHLLWDESTHPEMTPGEHRWHAVRLAVNLIKDGSVWPDEVTVTHFVGSHGTFKFVGYEIDQLDDYDGERDTLGYWERVRQPA